MLIAPIVTMSLTVAGPAAADPAIRMSNSAAAAKLFIKRLLLPLRTCVAVDGRAGDVQRAIRDRRLHRAGGVAQHGDGRVDLDGGAGGGVDLDLGDDARDFGVERDDVGERGARVAADLERRLQRARRAGAAEDRRAPDAAAA